MILRWVSAVQFWWLPVVLTVGGCASGRPVRHGEPETHSLLGQPLYALPVGHERDEAEAKLAAARAALDADPHNPEKVVWVGRRLGYLWRMREAIDTYTGGIAEHPGYASLYRHRGHRHISIRRFDAAIADLQRAAELIAGRPDEIEPDGQPNAVNIPLTTLGFNVWYHLALARYLSGDFGGALQAYRITLQFAPSAAGIRAAAGAAGDAGRDDNLVATTFWMYLTLMRLDRRAEAAHSLQRIPPEPKLIENAAYLEALRVLSARAAAEGAGGAPGGGRSSSASRGGEAARDATTQVGVQNAIAGYARGMKQLLTGDRVGAEREFEQVVVGEAWPAFALIAAEVELVRMRQR